MPSEHIARSWLTASQEERPQQKPTLLLPWSWTSILQNCGKIHFCCLRHPVDDILLWQPKQTKAHTYPFYKRFRKMSGHTVTKPGSKYTSALTLCSLHSLMLQLRSVENTGREWKGIEVYKWNLGIKPYWVSFVIVSFACRLIWDTTAFGNLLTCR